MAKKKQDFAKQDERLEEVNETLTGAGKWIEDNANVITWVVAAIALVVMGVIAINQYVIKPKALEASNENAKAVVYFMNGDYDKALNGDEAECIGFAAIADEYKDPDNTYIGARLVVMGIAYNTQLVDEEHIPTKWEDLLDDYFTDQIILTDAVESGTMAYALGALVQNEKYGWDFFEQLSEKQHAELNSSASGTHNDIAAGGYLATIGVDYVTQTLTNSGSPIEFVYPEEDTVVIYGPMAIMKDTKNDAAAKVFFDWVLSKEGQQVLADASATPIRNDVVREGSMAVSEIHQMEGIDDVLMNENTSAYFDKFDELFK